MHIQNISVLRDEAQRLLNLEIDILEKMLGQDAVLGQGAAGARGTFTQAQTRLDLETLQGEQRKLQSMELVIAVVGTMKAGKSTTINAIIGTEALPNRNRPMTALPTLIRHTRGQVEPVLEFANSAPIERLVKQLRHAVNRADMRPVVELLRKDTEMAGLLRDLDSGTPFEAEYHGADRIFTFLRTLNDLVRLSKALDVPFPFGDYDEIHELPVIKVEFAHLRGSVDAQGTLTLLDTPGPNEAGQQHLGKMLRDQLAKASAVLAVLDFTQLKSDACAQIQAHLKEVADVAAGRMYALVNKFDQTDRNSDTADEVRRFVSETLTEGRIGIDAIFPVSSKKAYLANRARTALALGQALPAQPWVEDFGKEALGPMWEEWISDPRVVDKAANKLWASSLFEAPINDVIRFAQSRAAILSLGAVASKLVDTADRLGNFFNTRQTALGKSSRELQSQIQALQKDIERVEASETAARKDAEASLKELEEKADQMLRAVKQEVSTAIEEIFIERLEEEKEKTREATERKSSRRGLESWFGSFFEWSRRNSNRDHTSANTPYFDPEEPVMTFTKFSDAEMKLRAVNKHLTSIVEKSEDGMKQAMSSALTVFNQDFSEQVLGRARTIMDEMRSRLKSDGFELRLDIPKADTLSLPASGGQMLGDLIQEKTETETRRQRKSGVWGTFCGWFETDDWGWEEYSVNVEVYKIDSRQIRKAVNKNIDDVFNGLNKALAAKIRSPLEKSISEFFRAFKETVEHIRGDLLQGMADLDRNKAEQEGLLKRLVELNKPLPAIQSDSEGLKRDVGDNAGRAGPAAGRVT